MITNNNQYCSQMTPLSTKTSRSIKKVQKLASHHLKNKSKNPLKLLSRNSIFALILMLCIAIGI